MDNDELILSTLLEVKEDMGRFIAKCESTDSQLDDHDNTIDKHDTRLRRIEVAILPIYAAIFAAATWAIEKILHLFSR